MAGSVAQVRRSAAFVSSTGTFDPRNSRMSVPAVIDCSDGKLAGSKGGEVGEFATAVAAVASFKSARSSASMDLSSDEPSGSPTSADCCFIRDQRDKMLSDRVI